MKIDRGADNHTVAVQEPFQQGVKIIPDGAFSVGGAAFPLAGKAASAACIVQIVEVDPLCGDLLFGKRCFGTDQRLIQQLRRIALLAGTSVDCINRFQSIPTPLSIIFDIWIPSRTVSDKSFYLILLDYWTNASPAPMVF